MGCVQLDDLLLREALEIREECAHHGVVVFGECHDPVDLDDV